MIISTEAEKLKEISIYSLIFVLANQEHNEVSLTGKGYIHWILNQV